MVITYYPELKMMTLFTTDFHVHHTVFIQQPADLKFDRKCMIAKLSCFMQDL